MNLHVFSVLQQQLWSFWSHDMIFAGVFPLMKLSVRLSFSEFITDTKPPSAEEAHVTRSKAGVALVMSVWRCDPPAA